MLEILIFSFPTSRPPRQAQNKFPLSCLNVLVRNIHTGADDDATAEFVANCIQSQTPVVGQLPVQLLLPVLVTMAKVCNFSIHFLLAAQAGNGQNTYTLPYYFLPFLHQRRTRAWPEQP